MDTKSTKFNARLIVKIIAVILALVTVGITAMGAIDDLIYMSSQQNFDTDYYFDGIFVKDKEDFYKSKTFDSCVKSYLYELNRYVSLYGDGTKASFEKRNKENKAKFDTYKHNMLTNLYREIVENEVYSESMLSLVAMEVIDFKLHEGPSDGEEFEEVYVHLFDTDTDYEWELFSYCEDESSKYNKTYFQANREKAKALGGELFVELPLVEIEQDNYKISFEAGTYILKVNEDIMRQRLIDFGLNGYFGTYEEYKEALKDDFFRTSYKNINYVVTLDDGTVVTNAKNQTVSYSQYDYYLTGSDGEYTSNTGSVYYEHGTGHDNYRNYYVVVEHRPAVHEVQNVVTATTLPGVTSPTEPTTYKDTAPTNVYSYSASKADSYDLIVCFNQDAVFHGEKSLDEMRSNLIYAGSFSRNAILNVVLGLGFYLIMLVLLCILSGRRRSDDEEVHLLATDKIFIELKLLISGGLIFLAGCGAVFIADEYFYMSYALSEFSYYALAALAVAAAGILTEFIVSLTKIIKAKRFIKSLFIVWLAKKPVKLIIKLIKKLFALLIAPAKAMISLYKDIKEKYTYTRNIKKIVLIKTGILAGLNILSAIVCLIALQVWGGVDHFGELFLLFVFTAPALFADVYSLMKGLQFVGGVDRLLEVLNAYRKGNLDTYINRAAIPDYLIPAAEDLEELGDGIRLAVEEAVRQETTKTELITNISHDLKTPLTSIINYVELLKHCDIQNETALSYLEVLGEKSDRLKYLISDLVEASKAATGNIDVHIVDVSLKEIIAQITGEQSDTFDKKQLVIVCDIPENDIVVKADSKLLYRVLENLTGNINKYAMPSTRVYISAEEKQGKGIITFKNISAAPLNITPDELKQRFVRGDASRTTEGNGLGLSIAENLCTLQNGKLDIEIVGDLFIARVELEKK